MIDIIILAIIAVFCALAIRKIIKNRGGCSSCANCSCGCEKEKKKCLKER